MERTSFKMPNYYLGNPNLLPEPNQKYTQLSSGVNSMMSNIMNTSKQFEDFANQLKSQTQAYEKGFDKFNTQFESIMNDLLSKKNSSTGNIFNDFLTSYKGARESGVGSGLREGILGLFSNKKEGWQDYTDSSKQSPLYQAYQSPVMPEALSNIFNSRATMQKTHPTDYDLYFDFGGRQ